MFQHSPNRRKEFQMSGQETQRNRKFRNQFELYKFLANILFTCAPSACMIFDRNKWLLLQLEAKNRQFPLTENDACSAKKTGKEAPTTSKEL